MLCTAKWPGSLVCSGWSPKISNGSLNLSQIPWLCKTELSFLWALCAQIPYKFTSTSCFRTVGKHCENHFYQSHSDSAVRVVCSKDMRSMDFISKYVYVIFIHEKWILFDLELKPWRESWEAAGTYSIDGKCGCEDEQGVNKVLL